MSSTSDKRKLPTLAAIFLRWLLVAIIAALFVILILSWNNQTTQADESGTQLLHNVVQNVSLAVTNADTLAAGADTDMEAVAEFYGTRIQAVKQGGILIVQDGYVVGDAVVDFLGQPVADTGIPPESIAGGKGAFHAEINGERSLCYFETPEDGTAVIALLPDRILYAVRNTSLRTLALGCIVLFSVLYAAIVSILKKFVISGVHSLNHSLEKITAGDLTVRATARSNMELASLSDGINSTVGALKDSIAAEAARIDSELRYARQIQMSALPRPEGMYDTRFDIACLMKPAKEVGGDFYDFFYLDENTVGLVVADVSGKGIPAALYMMSVMKRVRSALQSTADMAEAFFRLNNQLAEEGSEMFVTLFAAKIHLQTGAAATVNAGHNSPLLRGTEPFAYLPYKHDFVLGGMADMPYHVFEFEMQNGGILFAYTDGVTECMDKSGGLYGEERLQNLLNGLESTAPTELVRATEGALARYSAGAEQSDDITAACFRYIRPPSTE